MNSIVHHQQSCTSLTILYLVSNPVPHQQSCISLAIIYIINNPVPHQQLSTSLAILYNSSTVQHQQTCASLEILYIFTNPLHHQQYCASLAILYIISNPVHHQQSCTSLAILYLISNLYIISSNLHHQQSLPHQQSSTSLAILYISITVQHQQYCISTQAYFKCTILIFSGHLLLLECCNQCIYFFASSTYNKSSHFSVSGVCSVVSVDRPFVRRQVQSRGGEGGAVLSIMSSVESIPDGAV